MTKPELGTKRLCAHCGVKFYDLHQAPITCPKCGAAFEKTPLSSRSRALGPREAARKVEPVAPEAAQFDARENAEAGAQGKPAPGEPPEADDEVEAGVDDAGLLEEREEDEAEDPEDIGDDNEEEDLK
jgi:uncharacterized protein (TIGR02300 family)